MSEELKKGIPKAVSKGKVKEFTDEEREQHDKDLEKIFKKAGILKENESIKDMKHPK